MEILLKLFLTFLKIGLVSIGGGYAVIPSIHEEVVVKAGWIGEKVFADIITISQMTPLRLPNSRHRLVWSPAVAAVAPAPLSVSTI